jgi:poly(3-hydroxybutyrate) depolymerase
MIATGMVKILGTNVQLWVGSKSDAQKGPILIYWHGTGGNSAGAQFDMGANMNSEILGQGGVIAAPNESTKAGSDTGNSVWYTGDFDIADEVVDCAVQQLNIDTSRIYTSGSSAGGLQAGVMAYQRSSYLAASNPNSGGIAPYPGEDTLQDPSHVPAVMTMHGAVGSDVVVIDFSTASLNLDMGLAAKGGFAVDCNHGGGHGAAPADLRAAGWEFLKAHPFLVSPEPYAGGLPSTFPSYCKVIK